MRLAERIWETRFLPRGPVIGPLVICGVLANEEQEQSLVDLGVKDSKMLTPVRRERMFDKIKSIVEKYEIIVIEPQEIDAAVGKKDGKNLNWLEADKSIQIIEKLKPFQAVIDCPSNNIRQYKDYIITRLKTKALIVAEHKADQTYPIVSAASILAKVTRDDLIQEIKKKYKIEFGSGYMTDPLTQVFIKNNWNKYPIFRTSWESYKDLLRGKSQTKLFQDE